MRLTDPKSESFLSSFITQPNTTTINSIDHYPTKSSADFVGQMNQA
jgi:hypothetical protein